MDVENLTLFAVVLFALCVIGVLFWHNTKLRTQIARLQSLTYDHELTGLGNRRRFDDYFPRMVAHTLRAREPLTLLYVDVNKLKEVNDKYGHSYGDQLIRIVANALRSSAGRPTDLVCCVGGDEFTVALPDTDERGARVVCERFVKELAANDLEVPGGSILVCASVGGTTIEFVHDLILVDRERYSLHHFRNPVEFRNLVANMIHIADTRMLTAKTDHSVRSPIHLS